MHLKFVLQWLYPLGPRKHLACGLLCVEDKQFKMVALVCLSLFQNKSVKIYVSATGSLNKKEEKICLNWTAQQLLW